MRENPDNNNLTPVSSSDDVFTKYEKVKEISIPGGHKLSLGSKMRGFIGVADVYVDGKLCGTIQMSSGHPLRSYSLDYIGDCAKVIGDEIYFKNGYNFQKIKDGQIYTLEDVRYISNYNGQAITTERDDRKKLYHVKLDDREFGEGYNFIEDIYGNDISSKSFDFNISFGKTPKFGCIGTKLNGKKVFVSDNFISEEFDDINFDVTGNWPRMIGKNVVYQKGFPECNRYR